MDITAVDICNSALDLIGEGNPIVSFDDGSAIANLLKRRYPLARNEVLRMHEWNFAIHREDLAQLSDTPVSGYSYQYQLPVTPLCLRVLEMVDSTAEYRIEGNRLLTNEDEVSIRYIKEETNTTRFDTLFIKALAARIAADVAYRITQNQSVADKMESLFEYYLIRAKGKDNLEATEPDPTTSTSWIDAGR